MAPRNYPFKIEKLPASQRAGKVRKDLPHYRHPHELVTAKKLIRFGSDVLFLKPDDTPNSHTADCLWRNELWEMKSPTRNRSENIIEALKSALPQSHKIIIDLSRSRRDIRQAAGNIVSHMRKHRGTRVEKVLVLSPDEYCEILKSVVVL